MRMLFEKLIYCMCDSCQNLLTIVIIGNDQIVYFSICANISKA